MTPTVRLQAAIDKIEQLKAESVPGPWEWEPPSGESWPQSDESLVGAPDPVHGFRVPVLTGWGYDASGIHAEDADRELIVTLHRTIDAQLAILRHTHARIGSKLHRGALPSAVWSTEHDGLALADAILGEASS